MTAEERRGEYRRLRGLYVEELENSAAPYGPGFLASFPDWSPTGDPQPLEAKYCDVMEKTDPAH